MEENRLEESQLTQLVENLPTANEKKKLKEYIEKEGNTDRLCNAEKYMAAIINIPFCEQRLKCMVFKCQFPSMVDELNSNAELIHVSVHTTTTTPPTHPTRIAFNLMGVIRCDTHIFDYLRIAWSAGAACCYSSYIFTPFICLFFA